MSVEKHRRAAPLRLVCAILTVSDSRTEGTDRTGDLMARRIKAAGHEIPRRERVPDDILEIRKSLRDLLGDAAIDAILVNGGTGVARRDVTPEAVEPLLDKSLPGFGEVFRALSFKSIKSAAMMSRALAGVAKGKAIFVLPGAPEAAELAMTELILPELGHMVAEIRK